jgi:UV DNA damage endonuclease
VQAAGFIVRQHQIRERAAGWWAATTPDQPSGPQASATPALRLGFPVRVVGQPALRSHDSRRAPHLSVSLVYLRDILQYLQRIGVRYYRLAATLLPDEPRTAAQQQAACERELALLAAQVQQAGLRLSMHLPWQVALGSPDAELAARGCAQIEQQAALLTQLGAQRDGVLVVHVGGSASDAGSLQRFAQRYAQLSPAARARLVVEHDSAGWSLGALLRLHQQCGVPLVFDYLHWQLNNPEGLPLDLALGLALATWPAGVPAEVHMSTARSEAHLLPARQGQAARVLPPQPGQHADFVAASDMLHLLRAAQGLPAFDMMLEAKAGDLALLRLRSELARLAPALAARLG